jgi:hypothetical protein
MLFATHMPPKRGTSAYYSVVCNAGRSENYRAAARQPGVVPGNKKKTQNNKNKC